MPSASTPRGFDPATGEAYARRSEDTVAARLAPGEFVMPRDSVERIGVGQLEQMRAGTHEPRNPRQRALSDYRTLVAAEVIRRDRKRLEAALHVGAQELQSPKMEDGGMVDDPYGSKVNSYAFGTKVSDSSTYAPPNPALVAQDAAATAQARAADAMATQMAQATESQNAQIARVMDSLRRL